MNSSNTARQHAPRPSATPRPVPGKMSRSVLAAAAAALMVALALVVAPSASAHDALIGSTPKDGATVDGALESVELEFSGELKPIGNQVSLSDAEGTKHDAETSISGSTLTVDFGKALPAGKYTLVWRVVSSDGHPIEGTTANHEALTFTTPGEAAASSTPSASSTSSAPAMSSPATAASSAPAQDRSSAAAPVAGSGQDNSSAGLPGAVIWIIIAVAVVAAAATVVAKVRRQGGAGR